jgi:hypothetical protein
MTKPLGFLKGAWGELDYLDAVVRTRIDFIARECIRFLSF